MIDPPHTVKFKLFNGNKTFNHGFLEYTINILGSPNQDRYRSRGSPGLKVKFKFSLSPETNIVMHIHMHGDI